MTGDPLIEAFERQARWCREPSPFTARLLERSVSWLGRDAAAHAALAAVGTDPVAAATPLRWAGALHHLALRALQPWAALWPPSGRADDAELDDAIERAWREQRPAVEAALALPPQTNEVARSAVLLPGLLHIAARTGLPLALAELGASAGLNLWCERHRYDYGAWSWGAGDAPLRLRSEWRGRVPDGAAAPLRIVRRAGNDAAPIDIAQPDERLRLTSFVWPDQNDRLQRLRGALAAATRWMQADGVAVERTPAPRFVARVLAPTEGQVTVLQHSIVWQYMERADQAGVEAAVRQAAAAATDAAPVAWLRMEPPPDALHRVELRCRIWPGGDDRLLAHVHPHAAWIEWQA